MSDILKKIDPDGTLWVKAFSLAEEAIAREARGVENGLLTSALQHFAMLLAERGLLRDAAAPTLAEVVNRIARLPNAHPGVIDASCVYREAAYEACLPAKSSESEPALAEIREQIKGVIRECDEAYAGAHRGDAYTLGFGKGMSAAAIRLRAVLAPFEPEPVPTLYVRREGAHGEDWARPATSTEIQRAAEALREGAAR